MCLWQGNDGSNPLFLAYQEKTLIWYSLKIDLKQNLQRCPKKLPPNLIDRFLDNWEVITHKIW